MRPLGSDPCQIRTTCAETPDRTLGLSCARTQTTVSRKSMSWEAEPHTASGSSRSSHSRQIHTSPRVSRALSVAGTMVTPQAGQIGGRSSSTHGVWSLEQLAAEATFHSARVANDSAGGYPPFRSGDRDWARFRPSSRNRPSPPRACAYAATSWPVSWWSESCPRVPRWGCAARKE